MLLQRPTYLYPLILATYPVAFYYAENTREAITVFEVGVTLGVFLATTIILLLLLKPLIKDNTKRSIVVSVFLVVFFSYGAVQVVLPSIIRYSIAGITVDQDRFLLPAAAIGALACVIFVLRSRRNFGLLLQAATIVALLLIVFNFGRVGLDTVRRPYEKTIVSQASSFKTDSWSTVDGLPDIYYIILDAYGRADILREIYNFDNSDFLESLTQKGFFIASESRSNYVTTELSLAASLNMRYMSAKENAGWAVKENTVLGVVKQLGYQYVHLRSGIHVTKRSKHADVDIGRDSPIELLLNDFLIGMLRNTIAVPVAEAIGTDLETPFAAHHNERFKNNMLALREIVDIPGPTFTFNHNLPPHLPAVFDRYGNPPRTLELGTFTLYIDQIRYVNKVVEATVDDILKRSPKEPIIIIQGDHGPGHTGGDFRYNPTDLLIYERTAILNAYYLPESCRSSVYKTISPVNTFRMVFNSCFGADLGLLEDITYWNQDESPIDFSQISR